MTDQEHWEEYLIQGTEVLKNNLNITDYKEIEHLKGLFSFVLSVEKKNIENCYSEKMINIIREKGYKNMKELIKDLGKEVNDKCD